MEQDKRLRWLQELGLDVQDDSTKEWKCECPFCEEEDHLHLNSKEILFDCKKCPASGNYIQLMEQLALILAKELSEKKLAQLAKNRKLPVEAFEPYGVGWTDRAFTVPVKDTEGKTVNGLSYRLGQKLFSAPGCKQTLFGVEQLADTSKKDWPVIITEGFWDLVALRWLFSKAEVKQIVVSVPGAGVFKREWTRLFDGRTVKLAFDNDDAGAHGEAKIASFITGIAESLLFFRWDSDDAEGKDIRDLIIEGIQ